jgi:hypothetical protein
MINGRRPREATGRACYVRAPGGSRGEHGVSFVVRMAGRAWELSALVLANLTAVPSPGATVRPGWVAVPALGLERRWTPVAGAVGPGVVADAATAGAMVVLDAPGGPVWVAPGQHLQLAARARRATVPAGACAITAWLGPTLLSALGEHGATRFVADAVHVANAVLAGTEGATTVSLWQTRRWTTPLPSDAEAALEALAAAPAATDPTCVHALFDRRGFDGNTVGIAYLGQACAGSARANSMIVTGETVAYAALVLLHEYGHACGAPHPSGTCAARQPHQIMGPVLSSATRAEYEDCSVARLTAWRASLPSWAPGCLTNATSAAPPADPPGGGDGATVWVYAGPLVAVGAGAVGLGVFLFSNRM